jgi:hypothetical protein
MTTAVAAATMKAAQVTAPRPIPNRHTADSPGSGLLIEYGTLIIQPAHA